MNTKICPTCGNSFNRPLRKDGKYLLSITLWKRRIFCSNKCSCKIKFHRKGSSHGKWKDSGIGYAGIHRWIRTNYKAPDHCSKCGKSSKRRDGRTGIQWASKNHGYTRNIKGWVALCYKCHRAYDRAINTQNNQTIRGSI